MYNLGFEEEEEPEIKLSTFVGSHKKHYKPFHSVDHNKLWKILKETGVPAHLTCLLRNLYAGLEVTFKPNVELLTDSKLGKE